MKESQIHQAFAKWCDVIGLPYLHSRTDRRTTVRAGEPDFYVFFERNLCPAFCAIEFKVPGGKLSGAQQIRIGQLRMKCGYDAVTVAYSLEDAIKAVDTIRFPFRNNL